MSIPDGTPLNIGWDTQYLVFSFLISVAGAQAAVTLNEARRRCERRIKKIKLLISMSVVLGIVSIFAMHFVGMSALKLTGPNGDIVQIDFNGVYTIVSMASVVAVSVVGFQIASSDQYWQEVMKERRVEMLSQRLKDNLTLDNMSKVWRIRIFLFFRDLGRILAGGIVIASGICIMHYTAMIGQVMPARHMFNFTMIGASFLIATVAACTGLAITFRVLTFYPYTPIQCLASFVIGVAVTATHYTGIYASSPIYDSTASIHSASSFTIPGKYMSTILIVLSLVLTTIIHVWAEHDMRRALKIWEPNSLHEAMRRRPKQCRSLGNSTISYVTGVPSIEPQVLARAVRSNELQDSPESGFSRALC